MKHRHHFLLILCIFAVSACEEEEALQVTMGEVFTLEYGEVAIVDTEELISIRIDDVEDSRCPADAVCVWEGEVNMSFLLGYGDKNYSIVLNQGGAGATQFRFGDEGEYVSTLVSIFPEPSNTDAPYKLADYSAELVIENEPLICTMEFNPQCGLKPIACITTPCQPIYETFSNPCMLAGNNAALVFEGQCGALEGASVPEKPSEPLACIEIYAPVCGIVGVDIQKYSNSCFAGAAGAILVEDRLCFERGIEF